MEAYTRDTRRWLDERFRLADEEGIYLAHQPIYGFDKGHCEPAIIEKYIRTYQIMNALSHIECRSLLDVGGAEGYKSYIAADLFGIQTRNCDLSEEACKRAKEIFHVESDVVDMHDLPYRDNAFDIVLCSESLEHVTDFRKAVGELLRVASKAVIITVPQEAPEEVRHNIEQRIPHAHIHSFDSNTFGYLRSSGYQVLSRGIASPLLRFPIKLLPVRRQEQNEKYPKIFVRMFNGLVPVLRYLLGKRAAAFLIRFDNTLCRITRRNDALLFVITKEKAVYDRRRRLNASAKRIIDYEAPYHFIKRRAG